MKKDVLVSLFLAANVGAQAVEASASQKAIVTSLQASVGRVNDESQPKDVAAAATAVVEALAGEPEQAALRTLVDVLQGAADWDDVRERHTDQLIDLYRRHRSGPHAYRLAPVVVVLERLAPEQPQVQFGLAEVFGVIWAGQDIGRAANALASARSLIPARGDGALEIIAKVVGFVGLTGDLAGGWNGITTLLGYLEQAERAVRGGSPVRVLTADDLVAFHVLADLEEARRTGDQAVAMKLCRELRKLQPRNPVYPLLMAEMQASFGAAWDQAAAKKILREFFELTEPRGAVPAANEAWVGWTDVSGLLRMLQWQPGLGEPGWRDMRDLRDYGKRLEAAIVPKVEDRLVISPDRTELRRQIERLEFNVPKLEEEHEASRRLLAQLERECEAAEREYRAARPGGGRFDPRKSDLRAKWSGLQRQVEQARGPAKQDQERCEKAQRRLVVYRERMARFGE